MLAYRGTRDPNGAGDAGEERIGVVHDLAEEPPRRRRQELDLRDERGDDVADFEQLRNFAESPLEAIDENDRNPLVFAERLEDGSEARIEPPLVRLVASERDWFSSLTTFALATRKSKRLGDRAIGPCPSSPRPAQSLRRRVASSLKSVGGHQGRRSDGSFWRTNSSNSVRGESRTAPQSVLTYVNPRNRSSYDSPTRNWSHERLGPLFGRHNAPPMAGDNGPRMTTPEN